MSVAFDASKVIYWMLQLNNMLLL